MNISIITVFPELYRSFLSMSLVDRAQKEGLVGISVDSLLSCVAPKERIDAPTFGHGAGMLIRPDVVDRAVEQSEQKSGKAYKIFFSPHGKKLDQRLVKQIADRARECGHLMVLPARYEGMDARVEEQYADEIISVGDFVLMGGDLPAMMLIEAVLRYVPGVVGRAESVENDSFSGALVDHPEYTAPVVWQGKSVPDVVRSGDHAALAAWRKAEAIKRTVFHHFDWLRSRISSKEERVEVSKVIPAHYSLLAHGDVVVDQDRVGCSSITSIDIHDIARSAKTYGLKGYFVCSPLLDQQRIAQRLLDFWHEGPGQEYNPKRFQAVLLAQLCSTIDEAIAEIERREGKKPLLIATSARTVPHKQSITYFDQETVWSQGRPVLFLFGTAKGLADYVVDRCDYLLGPIEGFSTFNHLSVRSAAAIVFDRWLGIQKKA